MKNVRTLLAASLAVLTIGSSLPALAQSNIQSGGSSQGWEQRKGGHHGEFLKDLNLTEDQKARLKAIFQAKREGHKAQRQAMMQKHEQLREMITNGAPKEQVIALQREISQQKQAMAEERINSLYEMKSILTPEQFAKFQQKMKERKGKWAEKRGGRYGHGGGYGG